VPKSSSAEAQRGGPWQQGRSKVESRTFRLGCSGYVPITAMMRYGILLDLVGFVVIAIVVLFLSPIVFG
jgi:hypothetical protein